MATNYGTGVYGSPSSTYSFVVIISGVYGLAGGSTYGTARYNSPVYLPTIKSNIQLEALVKNFIKDYGVFRQTLITTQAPLVAESAAELQALYNIRLEVKLPTLSTLAQFAPEQLIEAELMSDNFTLLAEVIRPVNNEERFTTGPFISFENSAGTLGELDTDGLSLAYQAKSIAGLSEAAKRTLTDGSTKSASVVANYDGFTVLSGESNTDTVLLKDLFKIANKHVLLPVSFYGSQESRLLFQPFEQPILASGLVTTIITPQNITVNLGGRKSKALDVSLRVGVKSTKAMTVSVYETGSTSKALGYTLHIPSGGQQERFVTRRFRVPASDGKLSIELSDKCYSIELRVLGTWN